MLHKSAVLFDFFVSLYLDILILTSFSRPYVRVRTPMATWNLTPRSLLLLMLTGASAAMPLNKTSSLSACLLWPKHASSKSFKTGVINSTPWQPLERRVVVVMVSREVVVTVVAVTEMEVGSLVEVATALNVLVLQLRGLVSGWWVGEIKSSSLELDSPASRLPQGVSPDPRRLSSRFVSLVI